MERTALKRIVARLLSLADAAECACAQALPIRILILFVLRYAERVAWEFVTGEPQHPHDAVPSGGSPDDAALLAQRFRELACLLDWQNNCEAALEAYLPDDQRLLSGIGAEVAQRPGPAMGWLAHLTTFLTPPATGPPVAA